MENVIEFKELELDIKPDHIVDEKRSGSADADRCEHTWEHLFRKIYSERPFWSNTDFNEKRKGTKDAHICYKRPYCEISGDMVLSFKKFDPEKDKKLHKNQLKYEYYKEVIKRDYRDDECKKYCDMLGECYEMTYSLHNFSLMPVNGSMNNVKGLFYDSNNQQLDRPDTFLYYLNEYFCKREKISENSKLYNEMIFKYAKGQKSNIRTKEENTKLIRDGLISFLDEFRKGEVITGKDEICSATYKYCKEMYLIDDKEFVEELIENGSKPIKTGEDVIRYMNLAKRYWKIKDKLLKQAESKE